MNDSTHNISVPSESPSYTLGSRKTLVLPKPQFPVTAKQPQAADASPVPDDFVWPTDYAGLLKLSEEHLRGFSPSAERPYSKFQQELRRRLHESMQAPKAPEIDLNAERVNRGRHVSTAEQRRAARIAELEQAKARKDWLPLFPQREIPHPYLNFLGTFEALTILKEWRPEQVDYELAVLKNFVYHSPTMRLEEHRHMLANRPPQDVREAILEEGKLIGSQHFKTVANLAIADLANQYDTTVKPKVLHFLKVALQFVKFLKEDAVNSEKDFFAMCSEVYGGKVGHHSTAVSKWFEPFISDLQAHIDRIEKPHCVAITRATIPPVETEIHRLFAIPTLPPQDWRQLQDETGTD